MASFRYTPIYGRNPWLMVEDSDEVADFFKTSGRPFFSRRRDIVHFGDSPHVYWIESGLAASSATTDIEKLALRGYLWVTDIPIFARSLSPTGHSTGLELALEAALPNSSSRA